MPSLWLWQNFSVDEKTSFFGIFWASPSSLSVASVNADFPTQQKSLPALWSVYFKGLHYERFPLVFCRRHVFESVWMWGKVHFRADIPSLCLRSQRCLLSTSLFPFSSAEKQILGPFLHFWKNTFFWGAFDKWNQNPLLKLLLSSVKPFTTSVSLKNASVRFFRVEKR